MTIILNSTGNPITREERIKINENWQRIMSGYTNLQMQINVLAGGEELEALIRRLNETVENANVAVQEAIEANNTATQEAIEANDKALQTALDTVSQTLTEVNKAISNADTATTEANAAKQGALDATTQAQTVINNMQLIIKNMGHKGTWNDITQFYKNNMVEYNGSTFIATQDSLGKPPPTLPTKSNAYWSLFAEKGATGATGATGLSGKDGKDGTGVTIIGSLPSEAELPVTGSAGDAYLIGGDLYVWQVNLNHWKNVGPIQGPEGKSAYDLAVKNGFEGTVEEWIESLKGPPGPEGPPGPPADLTEINQEVEGLRTEVTEHLAEIDLRITELEQGGSANLESINGLYREVAYMKLKEEGKERLKGGTVFADDFNGNRFGVTFNDSESNNVSIIDGKLQLARLEGVDYNHSQTSVTSDKDKTGASMTNRKIVILKNGWIVIVVRSSVNYYLNVYVNKNDGQGFKKLCYFAASSNVYYTDFDIVSVDNRFSIATHHIDQALAVTLDATTIEVGKNYEPQLVKVSGNNESSYGGISICYDDTTKEYTIAWSSRLYELQGTNNVSFVKSTNGTNWSTPTKLTKSSTNTISFVNPFVSCKDGKLMFVCDKVQSYYSVICIGEGITSNVLGSSLENTTRFGSTLVYGTTSAVIGRDSTIIRKPNGRIEAFFNSTASGESILKLRMATSIDGGNTWSNATTVSDVTVFRYNAMSDSTGTTYVGIVNNSGAVTVSRLEDNYTWTVKSLPTKSEVVVLVDLKSFSSLEIPPLVGITSTDIYFVGGWSNKVLLETSEGVAVYDIPSTTFVGAYVEKIGNITITATLNYIPMKSELLDSEYEFSKSLTSEAPAKLRLHLSRTDTSGGSNDAVTRILGGRA